MSVLLGGRYALTLESLGRLVVISLLTGYAYVGRTWAATLLAVLAGLAVMGLIIGTAAAGVGSLWGLVFLLNAVLYGVGIGLFFYAGAIAAFRDDRPDAVVPGA